MQISTHTLPQEEARQKYRELLASKQPIETPLNLARKRVYYSLSKGRKIIDIYTAFAQAGLNELGQPRIAVCRADHITCMFTPSGAWDRRVVKYRPNQGGTFSGIPRHHRTAKSREPVHLAAGTFSPSLTPSDLSTVVPQIPQEFMPTSALKNYYILWEVEHWNIEPPRDPLLLRRLSKNLFEILAEWELSDLEWAIARGAF